MSELPPFSPHADPVHTLTTQIDRVKLSDDGNRNIRENKPSLSQIPASLRPAHGAQVHAPAPSFHSQQRMEMPVPMITPNNTPPMYAGESLTMSYARSNCPWVPHISHSATPSQALTPPQPVNRMRLSVSSIPSTPTNNKSSLAQITIPSGRRASSTPASLTSPIAARSSSPSTVQCAGTTKAGKRCTRQVKAPPLVTYFASSDDEPIERLCFQHTKEVLQPTGFYSRKTGAGWVEFSDWIPSYLNTDTQAALRVEMERPPSNKDEDGYIYAYEIRDDRTPDQVHLKVGRSVTLARRLDQWSKQCTSKEVILRGWWPGTVESESSDDTSLLKGKIRAGEKGPFCHRLERLIHLELADLSVHAPYLKPGFPKLKQDTADPSVSPGRSPKAVKTPQPNKPCLDCGTVHKEIFSLRRAGKGPLKDGEWEKIVQPIINKWGRFVSDYLR